ncbi:MAG: peptidase S41 [bacterium]|nr:MAG: peptidase S41 [bacterium]
MIGFGAVAGFNWRGSASAATTYDHLRVFAEVLKMIQDHYVEEKTTKELSEGAIRGLLRTLDPHSAYMDPETFKSRKEETEGKFGGLGIEITVRDSYVTIVAPIDGTPAHRAGLQAGDKIINIDGTSAKNMNLMDAVKMMRGKIGADVSLTIFREEENREFNVTITRALINIHSVKFGMLDDEVGYVHILSFNQNTSRETRRAVEKLRKNNLKGLVLDLRNNPGGLLEQAVEVSRMFLKKGHTVVTTRGRTGDQNMRKFTRSDGPYTDFPMIVLINAGSASASEIVAGAFQDLKRAIVVGTTSFGKGSVQTIRQLGDGSGLSLTTARYYTPSGRMIHGTGIKPDINVKYRPPKKDDDDRMKPIREKELMERFNGSAAKKHNGKSDKSESRKKAPANEKRKVFDLELDNQLRRGLELIKAWEVFRDIKLKETG